MNQHKSIGKPRGMTLSAATNVLGWEPEAEEGETVLVYENFTCIVEKKDGFHVVLELDEFVYDRLEDAEKKLEEWCKANGAL